MKFDLFVYFHSPESLDLYGVKSGILPSEKKEKLKWNQHEKQKTHSYACQSYCVNCFQWQGYLGNYKMCMTEGLNDTRT